MKRDLTRLTQREYDVVVVGGGIFGICVAWDAALRGLSVALLERADFGHAATANCFKMVHGGIRYLQHADVPRVREASRERNVLLRIAPHLVHPLPFVLPTYGHGLKGKAALSLAVRIYDLLTWDRNKSIVDYGQRIPPGSVLSRNECLNLVPGFQVPGLTGAVVFYEAQIYNPARLALAYLRSAADLGAHAANYVEAVDFLRTGNRVIGVKARDRFTGADLDVRGKVTVNAAGPWSAPLLAAGLRLQLNPTPNFSRDAFLIVRGRLTGDVAVGVPSRTKDRDAVFSRGSRHLFLVPWRNHTLIGVWHQVHRDGPEATRLTLPEIERFIDEINSVYPAAGLDLGKIAACNSGLILFGDVRQKPGEHSYAKRSQLVDHSATHGLESLMTVIGARYTTARGVAERVVDRVLQKLKRTFRPATTAVTPIFGAQVSCFADFARAAVSRRPDNLPSDCIQALVHNLGSEYGRVLKLCETNPALAETIGTSHVIKAEVVHAVREEMAQKLVDVVFRRTELGTAEHPSETSLIACAGLMARELGWDNQRFHGELQEAREAVTQIPSLVSERVA